MSSGTILSSFTTMVVVREGHWVVLKLISLLYTSFRYAFLMGGITTISSGRMSSSHILGEDELEYLNFILSIIIFMLVVSTTSSRGISSLHILSKDELENCILFSI